jgi:xylulokinase
MSGPYLFGIDLGTTGTKTALFDAEGQLIADAYEETPLHHPKPGWVEQEPDDLYGGALRTIRHCLESSGVTPKEVAALAFSGQMAGVCTVDEVWQTPTRYDSWLDNRCAPYMHEMRKQQTRILELTGGYPSYTHGPKILWWMHEEPDAFKRIKKFLMPAAYVAGRMAGLRGDDAFIDYTYLHFTCLSDTAGLCWSDELCERFAVPKEKLPHIVKPWDIIGQVSPEAARESGLLEGTPIAAGVGDTVAGMLGGGMVEPGMALDIAGTAAVFATCLSDFKPDTKSGTLFTARHVSEDLWCAYAYINGGGLNLQWFRDQWMPTHSDEDVYEILNTRAAEVPPGCEGLIFLPHLGGRVCPNEPNWRGLWSGFSWSHKPAHFYRSLLEGVAYEYAHYLRIERELFPGTEFHEARVVAGGANSKLWNQIKADVLGIRYTQLQRQECTVLGAAIVAGKAAGVIDDVKDAARRFNRVTAHTEPDPKLHHFYAPYVDTYVKLLEQMPPHFAQLAALPEAPVTVQSTSKS